MLQSINWPALISFLVVTLLSPGPNNLSCISMGVNHGYKRALTYIWGIVLGITLQAMLSGMISRTLIDVFPSFERILRFIGAGYILWLAYKTLESSYMNGDDKAEALGFREGFLLQFLNIKAILFVLTIYNVYLTPILGNLWWIILAAVFLGIRALLANSAYALFGATIRRWLGNPAIARAFNIAVALMLAFNAVDLLGLPKLLFG